MPPAEASLPSLRPICIYPGTEHLHLDSSQSSQTQNIQNRIIFFHLPLHTSSSYVHYLSKWCCLHIVASQKPESYPRLLSLTHLHPAHHLLGLLLSAHFIPRPFIVLLPLTSTLSTHAVPSILLFLPSLHIPHSTPGPTFIPSITPFFPGFLP